MIRTDPAADPTEASRPARWISAPGEDPQHPLLRTRFTVSGEVSRATLVVSGLGVFHAHLNGVEVADTELEPGQTNFSRTALLCSYDITALLRPGANALGIELGRGFYAMNQENVWNWHRPPWRDSMRALAELHLEYADGRTEMIATSSSWKGCCGPITRDSMYGGEDYDCRLDPGSWTSPEFDDTDWDQCVEVEFPDRAPELRPQTHEPVRIVERLTPTWTRLDERRWVADFGSVLAGFTSYRWEGSGEIGFSAAHGERLNDDGSVFHESAHVTGPFQVDHVRLDSEHRTFQPRFSYKGFRYVQVDVSSDAGRVGSEASVSRPSGLELTGLRITSDLPRQASFSCSDDYLTRFHEVMVRTLDNNLVHIPTDTPTYEKNGWTGDAQTAIPAILTNYDAERFLAKWLDDITESQLPTGQLPVIAPSSGWGTILGWIAPEWTTVHPYLLDELVTEYGRVDLIERHLVPVLATVDWHLNLVDADGLVGSALGDYLSPGADSRAPEDRRLTASLFLARGLQSAATLCRRIGRDDEADRRDRQAASLIDAVNTVFLTPQGYRTSETEYRQTSNALALALGVVPPDAVRPVVDSLVADIRARDTHHHVGHIGARYLMQALSRHGHAGLALEVLRRDTDPGWKSWLDAGNSTWMEMWAQPRSRCHYFMGTPAIWLYEDLAGLQRGPDGWQSFTVRPLLDTDITQVRFHRGTRFGTIDIDWDTVRGSLRLTVPTGCTATVDLPAGSSEVAAGSHELPL